MRVPRGPYFPPDNRHLIPVACPDGDRLPQRLAQLGIPIRLLHRHREMDGFFAVRDGLGRLLRRDAMALARHRFDGITAIVDPARPPIDLSGGHPTLRPPMRRHKTLRRASFKTGCERICGRSGFGHVYMSVQARHANLPIGPAELFELLDQLEWPVGGGSCVIHVSQQPRDGLPLWSGLSGPTPPRSELVPLQHVR